MEHSEGSSRFTNTERDGQHHHRRQLEQDGSLKVGPSASNANLIPTKQKRLSGGNEVDIKVQNNLAPLDLSYEVDPTEKVVANLAEEQEVNQLNNLSAAISIRSNSPRTRPPEQT